MPSPNFKTDKDVMDDKHRNLKLRILSGAILIPLVLLAIYSTEIIFDLCVALVSSLMLVEWHGLVKQHPTNKAAWWAAGVLYVLVFTSSLLTLRHLSYGNTILLWLLVTVWSADTAAFVCGRTFGGPKLAPTISPAKTWSGFAGAVFSSFVIGVVLSSCMYESAFLYTTVLLGIISQVSDLLESWIKRKAGIKDSSSLIPGHGGILDRTDSLVLTAPTLLLLIFFRDFL